VGKRLRCGDTPKPDLAKATMVDEPGQRPFSAACTALNERVHRCTGGATVELTFLAVARFGRSGPAKRRGRTAADNGLRQQMNPGWALPEPNRRTRWLLVFGATKEGHACSSVRPNVKLT
jgi:hypothetical protein